MIPCLSTEAFTWSRWRRCPTYDVLGGPARTPNLVSNAHVVRSYAVGYAKAEQLRVRPKANNYAVMFFRDGEHSWCHLTAVEFHAIFGT